MYKKLFIASVFYLLGAALSLAFVSPEMTENKSFVLSLDEDCSEETRKFDEFLKTRAKCKDAKLPSGFAASLQKSGFPTHWAILSNNRSIRANKAIQAPFYILYHTLIFYDVH